MSAEEIKIGDYLVWIQDSSDHYKLGSLLKLSIIENEYNYIYYNGYYPERFRKTKATPAEIVAAKLKGKCYESD